MRDKNLTDKSHWDRNWGNKPKLPKSNYIESKELIVAMYRDFFSKYITPRSRILEIGCGGSLWLPYFNKVLGCETWGIDYSEAGVNKAQELLTSSGAEAKLITGDFFNTDKLPLDYFDYIWSWGFLEHFTNNVDVSRKMALHCKSKTGCIITSVPNTTGFIGLLHKLADPALYNQHIHFTLDQLNQAHYDAGLEVVHPAQYFGILLFTVVNFSKYSSLPWYRLFMNILKLSQKITVFPFKLLSFYFESKLLSPYLISVYKNR